MSLLEIVKHFVKGQLDEPLSLPLFHKPTSLCPLEPQLHNTKSPSDGPKKHSGSIRSCDHFPGRVMGTTNLAKDSSFSSRMGRDPDAHCQGHVYLSGQPWAGLWLGCSLFLVPSLPVKEGVGALGQDGMTSLTRKQDPTCSKYQPESHRSLQCGYQRASLTSSCETSNREGVRNKQAELA